MRKSAYLEFQPLTHDKPGKNFYKNYGNQWYLHDVNEILGPDNTIKVVPIETNDPQYWRNDGYVMSNDPNTVHIRFNSDGTPSRDNVLFHELVHLHDVDPSPYDPFDEDEVLRSVEAASTGAEHPKNGYSYTPLFSGGPRFSRRRAAAKDLYRTGYHGPSFLAYDPKGLFKWFRYGRPESVSLVPAYPTDDLNYWSIQQLLKENSGFRATPGMSEVVQQPIRYKGYTDNGNSQELENLHSLLSRQLEGVRSIDDPVKLLQAGYPDVDDAIGYYRMVAESPALARAFKKSGQGTFGLSPYSDARRYYPGGLAQLIAWRQNNEGINTKLGYHIYDAVAPYAVYDHVTSYEPHRYDRTNREIVKILNDYAAPHSSFAYEPYMFSQTYTHNQLSSMARDIEYSNRQHRAKANVQRGKLMEPNSYKYLFGGSVTDTNQYTPNSKVIPYAYRLPKRESQVYPDYAGPLWGGETNYSSLDPKYKPQGEMRTAALPESISLPNN